MKALVALVVILVPSLMLAQSRFKDFQNRPSEILWKLNPNFKHTTHVDFEQPHTIIKSQASFGSCWIYAYTSAIEGTLLNKTGRVYNLSENYMIYSFFKEFIGMALARTDIEVSEGGNSDRADWLAENDGMMPESAWTPRNNVSSDENASNMIQLINNRINRYRQDVIGQHAEVAEKVRMQTKRDLDDLMEYFFGKPPQTFVFNGKTYNPRGFQNYLTSEMQGDVRVHFMYLDREGTNNDRKYQPSEGIANHKGIPEAANSYEWIQLSEMEKKVIEYLRAGTQLTISVNMDSLYVDDTTGIASLRAFNIPEVFRPPGRKFAEKNGLLASGHSMHLIGYELNPKTGRIAKYKVKNSWSKGFGDDGSYYIYDDFIDANLISINAFELK